MSNPTILLDAPPAGPGTYDDEDFRVLSEEVERIAGVVGELIKVAQSQSDLIGILLSVTGVDR